MTKKAEKAAQVEANKKAAWNKKVRNLLGHVMLHGVTKLSKHEADSEFANDKTAQEFAAMIASREPVGRAVHPLKVQAVERARQHAEESVERHRAALEAVGWDIDKYAPYPDSKLHGIVWQVAYMHYRNVSAITQWLDSAHYAQKGDQRLVEMRPKGIERYINECEKNAAEQYDLFIIKLVAKIGPCLSATLEGSHVWSESILTVRKPYIERWRTHEIENVSKLGKYFPQWPTRLMKG